MNITYIEHNGTEHRVEANPGWTLMENAVKNGVPGMLAECGGSATCGTCRVLIPDEWAGRIAGPDADEVALLEYVEDRAAGARLSCQIMASADLDGLVVCLPESQYT